MSLRSWLADKAMSPEQKKQREMKKLRQQQQVELNPKKREEQLERITQEPLPYQTQKYKQEQELIRRQIAQAQMKQAQIRSGRIRQRPSKPSTRNRTIPSNVKMYVWRRDGGRCVECGSNEKLEYDHIIPVAKGGSNTDRNVQLLCEHCNRKKHVKIM